MLRPVVAAALCALALVPAAAEAATPRAVLAFLPLDEDRARNEPADTPILDRLDKRKDLALGVLGAAQGRYRRVQTMLDITQGTRVSVAAYDPERVPVLEFSLIEGFGGYVFEWDDAVKRADDAPAEIVPGLLASSVPGGVPYVGVEREEQIEAIAAADRAGRVRSVSLGPSATLAARVARELRDHRLVVAGLPTRDRGDRVLAQLLAAREPDTLVIVMQTPPQERAPQLLPIGIAGLGRAGGLTSSTTRQEGVVTAIDLVPTILRHLRISVPDEVKGQEMELEGGRDAERLERLVSRLRVVLARRVPALEAFLAVWIAVLLACGVFADRRGVVAGARVGALGLMWVPTVLLAVASLQPSRSAEILYLAGIPLLLGALTDRFVRWPRGPLVPTAVTLVAYTVDLARGSDLIIRSLLGPNPRFGSRFYGIGNELEISLTIILLVCIAALLATLGVRRSRGAAATFAVGGIAFGAVLGSGRLGADVGGVVTLGAGVAAATVLMLPGALTRRTIALACLVPVAGLVALAALDLATGGEGHFTRTVLRADSGGDLVDTVARRYELAFNALKRGGMPIITAIALLAVAYAIRYRERVYAPIAASDPWRAALWGGLAAATAGALSNDSGPILLVFGVFLLAFTTMYLRGDPDRAT